MKNLAVVVSLIGLLVGCTPTLQHHTTSKEEIRREASIQQKLAVDLRKAREDRLARISNSLSAAAHRYCVELDQSSNCRFPVVLANDDSINAFADGKQVYIPTGMIRFVESDDELAFIISHELAHNILGHMNKKMGNYLLGSALDVIVAATSGVNTQGAFGEAAVKAFSQDFESESDYLAMYIAGESGFDIGQAPLFWRKMAIEHPTSIAKKYNATHPSTPERFLALSSTLSEIENKKLAGNVLMPRQRNEPRSEVPAESFGVESMIAVKAQTYPVPQANSLIETETETPIVEERTTAPKVEVATQRARIGNKPPKIVYGKNNYQVSKLAMKENCFGDSGGEPYSTLLERVNGAERYQVLCANTTDIKYDCVFQECSIADG